MRTRFRAIALAVLLATAVGAPALAQVKPPAPAPGVGVWVGPPNNLPPVARGDRLRNLVFLLGAVKAAPDDAIAKAIEERIWALWASSRSDTANLLMTRVKTAIEAKDTDLALELLNGVIKIKPDYVEGWNRRATIYYMKKDYGRAVADIREILKREPRHFGARSGLGMILQDIGDDKQALEVFRRALAVHPRLQRIPDMVKTLQEKVEGRDI
jgi:tetratricopeptide (TPR) repeat protein